MQISALTDSDATETSSPNPCSLRPLQNNKDFGQNIRGRPRTQAQFDEQNPPIFSKRWTRRFHDFLDFIAVPRESLACSGECVGRVFRAWLPFIDIMRGYSWKDDFVRDIIAGLTVSCLQIPASIAYTTIAGFPPVWGLYTSLFPVFIYCFLGTSRHNSLGTFPLISLMVKEALGHLSPDLINSEERMLAAVISLTLLVGVIQMLAGILRLGFLSAFLSEPMISGFITAAIIQIIIILFPDMFGYYVKFKNYPLGNIDV